MVERCELEYETVAGLWDSIDTSLWHAEAYDRRGERGLAAECLRAAWQRYVRFADVLHAYADTQGIRARLFAALGRLGDGSLAGVVTADGAHMTQIAPADFDLALAA